jgi:glycogen debranching enzyme
VFIVFYITTLKDITIELTFNPDLSPMWPASIGGKLSYWDKNGFYVLSEAEWRNFAFFGGFSGKKLGNLPAHKLAGGKLRYQIELKKGYHEIPITVKAEKGRFEKIKEDFIKNKDKYTYYLKERRGILNSFLKNHLRIETPVPNINKALKCAILNINSAFVNNPELGEGLIAGYGLSGESERPGFAWYFGGDGLINSFALLNYGDFKGAKREIEFLLKFQRKDGKIMHELSQGAGFINWFEDFGYAYFHGDTTLYFATFLDFYLKRTGDIDLIYKYKSNINKLFKWMLKCDSDKDGIVEIKLAGAGASETGPLKQKMKTDIYLATLSIKSWEAMSNVYTLLKEKKEVRIAESRLANSKKALEKLFWNKENKYFSYAVKDDNSQIKEITVWPAIGMRFGVIDKIKGKLAQRKIASPEISSDWGTRFLSSKSKYYDPCSYNNGAVWPFLTGFSCLALYNYNNPYHAFSLLLANLKIIMDYDYGSPAELLSGDIYRPLDQSVSNQIWSSGNTISAFVEGLLGFKTDALEKVICLKPSIPLIWKYLNVYNLKIGKGEINIEFKQEKNQLIYIFNFKNLKAYKFYFKPKIPANRKVFSVNGVKDKSFDYLIVKKDKEKVKISIDIAGFVYPFVEKNLIYGEFSKEPIIENFKLGKAKFCLDIWGKGKSFVSFYSDCDIECNEGNVSKKDNLYKLELKFKNNWERKSIYCRLK